MIINENLRVLVQGATGKQGQKAVREMLDANTKVVAGVTPGKAGQEVESVPIYNSVHDAIDTKPNTACIIVPPLMVLDAAMEAMAYDIKLIHIFTENVPIKDATIIREYAKNKDCRVIGPSSVGIIAPGKGKIGPIGGGKEARMFSQGPVGILSKSGGMCAETARLLTAQGLGQSTVVGIGGDVIAGSDFVDLLELFEKDIQTKAVVMIGEIGGAYEELVAKMLEEKKFTKPLIAFIMGRFAEKMGAGLALGHAGAIVELGFGTAQEKRDKLEKAGALIAKYHDDIPDLVKKAIGN